MQKLNEWSSGKAGWVTQKVYALLTKYTGVKFKIIPFFQGFKNKWGFFIGKLAHGSNGRFYRLNFLKGKTEQIVSMDVWNKGQEPGEVKPAYTCSLEGFGIGKVITMLKDFILAPEKALAEGIENEDESYTPLLQESVLNESSDELKMFIKDFLLKNPSWQNIWASGNNVDPKQYFDEIKAWIKANTVNGAKYSNKPVLTTAGIMNNTKTLIKKDPSALGNLAGSASNAQKAPSTTTLKGVPETIVDVSDIYEEKITFDQIQTAMVNLKKGPLAQYQEFVSSLKELLIPFNDTHMLIVWGKAGIGKTYTFEEIMQEMGVSKGDGWVEISDSFNRSSPSAFSNWIASKGQNGIIFLIDDNEKLFGGGRYNTWKRLVNNTFNRSVRVEYPLSHKLIGDELPTGDYPVDCKFVVLSNKEPTAFFAAGAGDDASLDDIKAMVGRVNAIPYNFTDEETMAFISEKMKNIDLNGGEDYITDDDKARIFNLMWKGALKRKAQGIERTGLVSFRIFSRALRSLAIKKATGKTFDAWFHLITTQELLGLKAS